MMPGFITNTLDSTRAARKVLSSVVAQYFKENPPPSGPQGVAGRNGLTGPQGPAGSTLVANSTVAETLILAVLSGWRTVAVSVPGVVPTESYIAVASASIPDPYEIGSVTCVTAGQLRVKVFVPNLAIGARYSFAVRFIRINV